MYPMYLTIDEHERHASTSESWASSVINDDEALIFAARVNAPCEPEAIEIGVTDVRGNEVFYRRLKPRVTISSVASQLHGITDDLVRDEPAFSDVVDEFTEIVRGKRVILYNSFYDYSAITNGLHFHYLADHPAMSGSIVHPFVFEWIAKTKVRFECFAQRYGHWKKVPDVTLRSFMWRLDNRAIYSTVRDCKSVVTTLAHMKTSGSNREILHTKFGASR